MRNQSKLHLVDIKIIRNLFVQKAKTNYWFTVSVDDFLFDIDFNISIC